MFPPLMAASLDGIIFMFLSFAATLLLAQKKGTKEKRRPSGASASLVDSPLTSGGRVTHA
jgi:hypothetical protein